MSEPQRPLSILLLFLGDPRYDRRIKSFAAFLRSAGHDVRLICGLTKGATSDDPRCDTISLTSSRGPRKFIEYHRKLTKKLLKSPAVDLMIACDLYSLGAVAIAKKRGRALRAIYDSREVYTELPTVSNRPLVRQVWRRFENRHLRQMDAILVTGTHDFEAIFAAHGFIPRGLLVRNLPELSPITIDPTFRKRFGIAEGENVFVYVGGLQKGRGIGAFIEVLPSIDETSKFVIIGDGAERKMLESLADALIKKGRVIFTGAIDSEEILPMLTACDVGVSLIEPVSLSYQYALPSKVFEYMAAGLTVLSSPLIHMTELFAPEEPWLFFAEPANQSEIVAVSQRAKQAGRQPAVRQSARNLFESELNATIELEKLTSLIDKMFGIV